jgi:hypothetical protein
MPRSNRRSRPATGEDSRGHPRVFYHRCDGVIGTSKPVSNDEYLATGYPIASGAIEGACRHLVKDRMERGGMHWTVGGAQAMLNVRSVYISGCWDEYQAYRTERQLHDLYPYRELVKDLSTGCLEDHRLRRMPKIPLDAPLDVADSFIHGIIQGNGGTCASIPVVVSAVGRRLG